MSTTLTIRMDEQMKERLDRLAESVSRTRSYLVTRALQEYLDMNEWHVAGIVKAMDRADSPDAGFASHEAVTEWLESWGGADEKEPPKCE